LLVQLSSGFSSVSVTFNCMLSGMLAHYSSNRFILRPDLIELLHARLLLWLAVPPTP